MLIAVSTTTKVAFEKEIEKFKGIMVNFLLGKGNAPLKNINEIFESYVKVSVTEMVRSGCERSTAKRISKNTLKEILEDLTEERV